jgi:hypothetical protein
MRVFVVTGLELRRARFDLGLEGCSLLRRLANFIAPLACVVG